MTEISLSEIYKSYGFKKSVLDGFNFDALSGERIALIGPNGSGKTTLFKIITSEEGIQSGSISIRKGATIGMLSQIPSNENDKIKVIDLLKSNFKEVYNIETKMRECEHKMSSEADEDKLNKLLKEYSRLQTRFEELEGYEVEAKISKICNGFRISEEMMERSFSTLSGGEKTLISLASLMLKNPSILLLDEPTNHLDIDTLEWFEEYLRNYKGTIIISSHDRYFLDQVVNKTVLIERGKSEVFHGNYSYYLEENEKRIMLEFISFKNQQKQIDAMRSSIKKLQEFGKLAHPNGEAFFKRAASIQKRLEKIEVLEKPEEKKELPIEFKLDNRSGKEVIMVKNLGITLGTKTLFKGASFEVYYGDKVCLMGKNGSGKSTFIKVIMGNIEAGNTIKIGSNVTIGYVPQEIKFADDQETIFEYAKRCFIGDETRLRSALDKFLFHSELLQKRVGNLSGGEKVRLKLFELIQTKANLLILDEPTNHIDIDTKEILEEALLDYEGTLFFVSHDRYFINKLAKRVLNIQNLIIKSYPGNYDYFKAHK